ncbi:tripartite tricarboxylate transporter TctB family protein [Pontibacillus marinus]|uniref:DUF1468 domain-containing protein n=1 Tax=Pontibacillus marinus BH030004 = DSM 16465 TaxID=1385511 RepID=A0A0A5GBG5_9BACI|nr:tripartite tricarboxylate transporter TctB family protein [Pontibacillus marinus]KGX90496.1 hypothetical protein N783_16720 [Pontibacillus marinus BH030004 = DSM 16465]
MKKVNYVLAGFMVLISLYFYFIGSTYTEDAGMWPEFFSIVLILLSIGLIIDTHLKPNREKDDGNEPLEKNSRNHYVIYTAISMIVYLLLMKYIGFLILTPLFIWLLLWLLNYRSIKKLIALSFGVTVGITLIFQILLKIPIPQGIFSNLFT